MLNGTPYIEVKKARIARAGRQFYSASEMKARTAKFEDTGKGMYAEYRPPEVLIKNLQKFNYVPFINGHTPFDLTPANWRDYAIGVVGGNAGVEVVNDELYITNDVVFYDQKAYEEYKAGKVELSARYDAKYALVNDADALGYSSVLLDIPSVNHIALVGGARAGHEAKIIDSLGTGDGGFKMKVKGGFLSFLGIGKVKDDSFKFSAVLMDSLGKVKADATSVETEISTLTEHVAKLSDSEARDVLAGAVADCYKNVDAVLVKKDEVGKRIDELYCKCQDAAVEAIARILGTDAPAGGVEPEKDPAGGVTTTNDSVPVDVLIDAAIEKAFTKISDGIDAKIDAVMRARLGVDAAGIKPVSPAPAATAALNDSLGKEDASFLVRGVFGN
jgi:hypothetical protein